MQDTNEKRLNCFDPIVDNNTKVLILGTLPGPLSLQTGEYYKNPNNAFWKIIYGLYDLTPPNQYNEKCNFLIKHYIGIWDVIGSANRNTHSDADIKNPIPNDFNAFFKKYPNISGIVFNGQPAEKEFKTNNKSIYDQIKHKVVLSSSGACARKLKDKIENWESAIKEVTK